MRRVLKTLGVMVAMVVGIQSVQADKTPAKKKPAAHATAAAAGSAAAPVGSAADDATGSAGSADDQLPPHITGPKLVDLGNGTEIDLPANTILFERDVAREIMKKDGNPGDNIEAFILRPGKDWAVIVDYDDVGYVSDSDADKLDPDDLFDAFKKGNEEQNARRKELGVAPLFLDGWSEKPRYDVISHHLLWGLKGHSDDGPVINFFTRVLGRSGFMSVNLIDAADRIEASKVDAANVLSAVRFKEGSRYADHKGGDKDSGIGLRGLVLGGTGVAIAAKSGLLLKLLLIFKKAIIFIVAAVGGFFRWLFGKKKKAAAAEAGSVPPPSAPPPPSDPLPPPSDPSGTPPASV
jgi:uncharacterized membrane-anchored protein